MIEEFITSGRWVPTAAFRCIIIYFYPFVYLVHQSKKYYSDGNIDYNADYCTHDYIDGNTNDQIKNDIDDKIDDKIDDMIDVRVL